MLPRVVLVLACLFVSVRPPVGALSVGWVYRDMTFDHPTFNVRLLDDQPLHQHSVAANTHHPTTCALHSDNLLASRGAHSTVVMTKPDGSKWSCKIPLAPTHAHAHALAHTTFKKSSEEIEQDEQESVKRGVALLDRLDKKCLRASFRAWTYEFCYNGIVRQYYQAATDEHSQPLPQTPVYLLGQYHSLSPDLDSFGKKRSPVSAKMENKATTQFDTKHDRNYLVQTWGHGDFCAMTTQRRQIRILYQCEFIPEERIHSVAEPALCSYVMIISTPILCNDPAFRIARPQAPETIDCRPITMAPDDHVPPKTF